MKGGERRCRKCIHGPTQRECDVYAKAAPTFRAMPYGGMYCGFMECEPIKSRIESAAKRMAGEWPERKAVKR